MIAATTTPAITARSDHSRASAGFTGASIGKGPYYTIDMIRRLALAAFVLGFSALSHGTAFAQANAPKPGDVLDLAPAAWGKQAWSFGAPSNNDAAGKVVIHWFCTPKVSAC